MAELGKAHIQEAVEEAVREEAYVNGTEIGRSAARRAAAAYFGGLAGELIEPVEAGKDRAIEA
jgi:hypothetical protein